MRMLAAGIVLVLVIAAIGLIWILASASRFDGRVQGLRASLMEARPAGGPYPQLPELVRGFATTAGGRQGGPLVIHARHLATLTIQPGGQAMPLSADQWTSTWEPGFVWHARAHMGLLPVSVIDAYVRGKGALAARIFGAIPVSDGSGPDFDKGELMRYLSELPLYPDAILNNASLLWRQVGHDVVEVTGTSPTGSATMRFYFDVAGDIVRMEADDRPMTMDGGKTVPTPWRGTYGKYQRIGSYRLPIYGEVGWVLPDGFFTYWRGTVVAYEPLP